MKNIFFPDEDITENDLYFVCYMVERVARQTHRHNYEVVDAMGADELRRVLSCASVLHCENPLKIESEWIEDYQLTEGEWDIAAVDPELCPVIPSATQMGKVYTRLITETLQPDEDYADAILRVYHDPICEVLDNYNASAYYEPSPVIVRAYHDGGF